MAVPFWPQVLRQLDFWPPERQHEHWPPGQRRAITATRANGRFPLLAPNPHNLQPWNVELQGNDTLSLYPDKGCRLLETDPFDRQITIGLGCFLEQMVIAASVERLQVEVALFPDGPDGPVARADFLPGGVADPLATAILARRSCKEPFEATSIEPAKIDALAGYATIVTDPDVVDELRTVTWQALLIELHTPRTMQESVDLIRFGKAQINANPDGIDLGGPFLESLILLGILGRQAQADPTSIGFKQGVEILRKTLRETPAYAVLVTDGNSRTDQIAAGRRWLRLNLAATQLGLALHPVSQCLQECSEVRELYERAHALLAQSGQTVQMLGRLGYGPQTPPSPRWPLEEKLRSS